MREDQADSIVKRVVEKYLHSGGFNGMGVQELDNADDVNEVRLLIETRKLDLVRGDGHANPHIKAFHAEPVEVQLEKIKKDGLAGCLYPTPEYLKEHGAGIGENAPYTRELMEGTPQLSYKVFDLRVLEWYRNDPRYEYYDDDIHGRIIRKEDMQTSSGTVVRDNLPFFEFGFAYKEKKERAVVAFIRYLHDLPEEQQIAMKGDEISGQYDLHPGFYQTQIIGDFPERISIYDAFLQEKIHINRMCSLIGKPNLFRTEHNDFSRPLGFGILIRSTKKEFRDFALQLDQLLSDDINRDFFAGDIELNKNLIDEDGNKIIQQKGTIQLLEEWIKKYLKTSDYKPLASMFKNLRSVRRARQKPAHMVEENKFGQKYTVEQRELIISAFCAVQTLRMVIENHKLAQAYKVPDYLRESKIWAM